MTMMEILLLIAGAVIFALGFFIPGAEGENNYDNEKTKYREEIKKITDEEIKDAARRVRDAVDEEVSVAHDNSGRSLEKLTNEKIMAINEYGKTVTDEIERNHKEVVFMYDMLNDKTTDIKNTIRKYEQLEKSELKKKVQPKKADQDNKSAAPVPAPAPKPQTASSAIHIPKLFSPGHTADIKDDSDKQATASPSGTAADKSEQDIASQRGSASQRDNVSQTLAPDTGVSGEVSNADIILLHKQGLSDVEIAKHLGIGVGEVKLAISFHEAGGPHEA